MRKRLMYAAFAACIFLYILMVFHADTVVAGAKEGVKLCLYTILPSLFPFLFLGALVTGTAKGIPMPILRPLGRLCGIPDGAETIFLVGILGGYPAGAQAVTQSFRNGMINAQEAKHLLRFCNNAGPAFIFGILGSILSDLRLCAVIWLVHIFSAIITGYLFNAVTSRAAPSNTNGDFSIVKALEGTVKTMGKICGWVIVFRILLAVLDNTVFSRLDESAAVLFTGLLELSNGCIRLDGFAPIQVFFIASVILSFGGICVWMQTASILGALGFGSFCIGKCVQSLISILLCALISPLLFSVPPLLPALAAVALIGLILCMKKSSSIMEMNRV